MHFKLKKKEMSTRFSTQASGGNLLIESVKTEASDASTRPEMVTAALPAT